MSNLIGCRSDIYRELDSIVGKTSSVIIGTGSISKLPFAELINFFGLNISVCDRSMESVSIYDAPAYMDECVFNLNPDKVFMYFGDECDRPCFDKEAFSEAYEFLIDTVAARCDCSIYILSVFSDSAAANDLNRMLSRMARENGCEFIDAVECISGERSMLRLFKKLSHYMRDSRISFGEAMTLANV